MMTPFKLNIVGDHIPMAEDNFFDFLTERDAHRNKPEKSWITDYLESLGFVVGQDSIDPADHERLKHIAEYWYRAAPYYALCKLSELLTPGGDYYLSGKTGRFKASEKLLAMVRDSGWIYKVTPSTAYFELIGNNLFAKYQSILGSRFLCEVTE